MTAKGILLDMDGVLAEVKLSYRRCIIETAASYGVNITGEDVVVEKKKGNSNNDWVLTRKMVQERGGGDPTLEEVTNRFEALYQKLCLLETLIPEVGLLEELYHRVQGKVAIVTGRPRKDCMAFLKRFDLEKYVSAVVCMEDGPPKPNPFPVAEGCRKLGLEPGNCLMIGDTPDDIISAVSAGAVGVGILLPDDHAKVTLGLVQMSDLPMVQGMKAAGCISIIPPGLTGLLNFVPRPKM
eukprot:TRINITY_DN9039_c0_g1_i1.p1 TRINITY_DN9039_c0_g1~~TRINITY_DN9039_c0_g1_i1.p1  ORF type:complete len:239 (+),score=44.35 TRINITY_DN9039_c0_g1_i1:70-786(+)